MNAEVHVRRCARHPEREAAARCPGCGGFFCRECVVEHGGRLLCAACLARVASAGAPAAARGRWRGLLAAAAGFLLLWVLFYGAARFLAVRR